MLKHRRQLSLHKDGAYEMNEPLWEELFRLFCVFPGNSLLEITDYLLHLSDFLGTYKPTSCFSPAAA